MWKPSSNFASPTTPLEYSILSKEAIQVEVQSFKKSLAVTEADIQNIEVKTRDQRESLEWFQFWRFRIHTFWNMLKKKRWPSLGLLLGQAWVSLTLTKQRPLWSIYLCIYVYMYRMPFREKMPPRSNSLDSFDFAMHHQFRKCYHHVQIIETTSILHVWWMYSGDDDEHQPCARCSSLLMTRHSLHWSQLSHSPLSRPTTATVSWATCKQNKSCTVL